jgi:hypothetical protein
VGLAEEVTVAFRYKSLADRFAAEFTPRGDGYIYRRRKEDRAIRVSAEERDRLISALRRRERNLRWTYGAVFTLMALGGLAGAIAGDVSTVFQCFFCCAFVIGIGLIVRRLLWSDVALVRDQFE